jgi:hypothetical protein
MPTKRVPLRRSRQPPISLEALEVWRQLRAIERQGATRRLHDEYQRLGRQLCGLVGVDWMLMIWPTDAKSAIVPRNLRHRPLQAEEYRRAYAARCALLAAEVEADRTQP